MAEYIFEINDALYNEKTGQAVMKPEYKGELVRCKDCKWSKQYMIFGREALMCKRGKYMDPCTVEQDGFCNYGDRK